MVYWGRKGQQPSIATLSDGVIVFANGERINNAPDPFTTESVFWKQFASPFYRIPAMVITDSGRIIIASDYRSNPNDQCAIIPAIAISDDGGKTWNKKVVDTTPFSDNANCRHMDPTMFIYNGVINIICGTWSGNSNNQNWTKFQNDTTWSVTRYYSNDNGDTWFKEWNFQKSVTGMKSGSSWLGAVGNCVITKFGTIIVPIQTSEAVGKVSAGFIYSNDGTTWKRHPQVIADLSESSACTWNASDGQRAEVFMFSRRDPNTAGNKACNYVYQSGPDTFTPTWASYSIFDSKIPARGRSGCQGSAMSCNYNGENITKANSPIISWANNFFAPQDGAVRDHIVIGAFNQTVVGDNSTRSLKQHRLINVDAGPRFGGYSIIQYNPVSKIMGIVYEDNGNIRFKNITDMIPTLFGY